MALAATGSGGLMPAPGQFFPVSPVKVLDTQDGTGGVSIGPLASGATATFTVTGVGDVPPAGDVSDVYVIITAIAPQSSGCLNDFSADVVNPAICTVSFEPGQNMSDSDIVQVSSSGQVSVTNESSGTTDVSVSVMGYFQADDPQTLDTQVPGDTYVPVAQSTIVDTRSGLGAPEAQVPAGGSLTVQVTGAGGVPSDAAGAGLFIGAANAASAGSVSAYPTGGAPSSLAILSYQASRTVRDLYFGGLSSAGQLTLVNNGSGPVDLVVGVQGYLVSPAAGEAGSAYQDVAETRIVDTRYGTGVPATPVPAGGSITFTATGVAGVPSAGVSSVAESVAAIGPTASGFLSVYRAGGNDPSIPGVNFHSGDNEVIDMSAPVLSAVSPAGGETVTNHSSGTVDVVVSVRGYYAAPTVPQAPESVSVSVSGTTATVDWDAPPGDGGAAITSYTVTALPDNATATVDGGSTEATMSGLANPSTDLFTVTATNGAGTSYPTTYSPPNVITGQILAPNGVTPVPGDAVNIYPNAPSTSSTPTLIGTATTDANGNWSFAVPPYAALPADSQAAANANGGWLNLETVGAGFAAANLTSYPVAAVAVRSAWVGTSSQAQSPAGTVALAQSAAVMRPNGPAPALSAAQAAAAYAAVNDPTATDSSGNPTGNPDYAYQPVPADKYGFQESGGDGSYNPNIASDGITDLTNAPVTAVTPKGHLCVVTTELNNDVADRGAWTIVGEYHSNWDDKGWFDYNAEASSKIGVDVSGDGEDWGFNSYDTVSNETGLSLGKGNDGFYHSFQFELYLNYRESHWTLTPGNCNSWWQWDETGITLSPGLLYSIRGANIWNDQNKSKTRWKTDGCTYSLQNLYNDNLGKYLFADQWPEPDLGLKQGHGITYGFAAKIKFPDPEDPNTSVSIGFQAETNHSVATEQGVEFDSTNGAPDETRYDPWPPFAGQQDTKHFFWGSNGRPDPNGGPEPRVMYNC